MERFCMDSIMGGIPQTKGRKVKLKKIIKLKHAHNSTIYNNPLIYIILLERFKKFFRIPDLLQLQGRQLEINRSGPLIQIVTRD